ncbi:MAG: glycosidase [Rhodobacterales bacterium CG15_BIG_FIL_POST_REV_8_21_14_020_59_13]|nr:DUF2840 domain-containing protein [Sphingomonadales bacterium]NCP26555.1 DUF2840 domain-containing protein [Sphingomonadales bacterium]NCP48595.1 DUF2840 domain-containing protein [Sphingomonadales bacterium]NCQ20152.1 DUF2840 domain-containing protein [Sphingomonadales bacterium]PIW27772.1 MAG: glycosidase [Rhodobacterales bacterium CG15_BIG_FIL_POST_REV_8_21_14_020_59_13]
MFGLSGTHALGRSGTESSDYREPESSPNPQKYWAAAPLNYPNKESSRFLLTAQRLCTAGALPPVLGSACAEHGDPPLTHVKLVWQQGIREDWLRFGKPVAERILDRRTRIESYAPGQVFALVRWASNDYGTVRSSLDIVRAVASGEAFTTVPQVDPGGEILLSVRGWPKVRQTFELIDAIEQAGHDPCEIAPDHWRHMHNRLAAGMLPRIYGKDRHHAWLRRRKLKS